MCVPLTKFRIDIIEMGGFPNAVLLEKAHAQIALFVRNCHGLDFSRVKYTDTHNDHRCQFSPNILHVMYIMSKQND